MTKIHGFKIETNGKKVLAVEIPPGAKKYHLLEFIEPNGWYSLAYFKDEAAAKRFLELLKRMGTFMPKRLL